MILASKSSFLRSSWRLIVPKCFSSNEKNGSIYSESQDRPVSRNYDVVNFEGDNLYFTGFNELGFHTNVGIRIVGPCAAFRKSTLFWNVKSAMDIDESKLSLFTILEPKLDILVIGKGKPSDPIDAPMIRSILSKYKIGVEILDTERALTTFNYLNSEGRLVAAALIPASYVDFHSEEREKIKARRKFTDLLEDPHSGQPAYLDSRVVDMSSVDDITGLKEIKKFNIKDIVRPDLKFERMRKEAAAKRVQESKNLEESESNTKPDDKKK